MSALAPVYKKFQPTPKVKSATKNCITSTPLRATATQTKLSAAPTAITGKAPKRLMRCPVKKLGTNMPSTCHSSTSAALEKGSAHCCMAMGVAAIKRFITP